MVIRLSACSIGNVRGGGPGVGEITINTGILGVYLREAEGLAAQMAVFPVLLLWSHSMYDVVFKGIPCTKKGLARGRSRFTGGCHPENIFAHRHHRLSFCKSIMLRRARWPSLPACREQDS